MGTPEKKRPVTPKKATPVLSPHRPHRADFSKLPDDSVGKIDVLWPPTTNMGGRVIL